MNESHGLASWANAITAGRLMLSPIMFWVIPEGTSGSWVAFWLWFALCVSDLVDGYIARRRGPTTAGAFLDPLADKVLILGAMFTLVSRGVFWVVPVVIIAAREFVISVYRVKVAGRGISVPASKLGKYKTLAQQLAVGFALLPWTALDSRWLWNGLLWVAVILAVVSGAQYLRRSRQPIPTNTVQPVA
jgi:CDP-diacylglycerol--glycerol-3-phosphate 3-phosphatidyltransferase